MRKIIAVSVAFFVIAVPILAYNFILHPFIWRSLNIPEMGTLIIVGYALLLFIGAWTLGAILAPLSIVIYASIAD